ncbi:MAG TPA: cytochrome c [Gaiellaceae bacterium]|jgi:cytochrome c551/c552|nr:cytochrome c [Gaiellaceae bacterium]
MRARPVILATCVLVLAGCGSEGTVSPRPEAVKGSVPKQTSTQATTQATTTTPAGGGTTTSGGGGGGASGKALFASNGCNSCHTYKPAGSNAKIGPDLDNLAQSAKKAKQPLEQFTRESIVKPNAYIAPGFPPNVMPSTFASLPKSQLDALVSFLTKGH